jgi:hypothetical protein
MHQPANYRRANSSRLAKEHRKRPSTKKVQSSAITNGRLLPSNINGGVDGRSAWVRRVRDLIAHHTADLGGADNISTAEQALVRRCATLITELERRELLFAQSSQIDDVALSIYQSGVNTLRRTLESLGLKRRMKTVGPSLGDILRNGIDQQREQQQPQQRGQDHAD